jgi:outer membrane biosynthesis protein TonB
MSRSFFFLLNLLSLFIFGYGYLSLQNPCKIQQGKLNQRLQSTKNVDPVWLIDEDSSDIVCESSFELKRMREEAARKEAERRGYLIIKAQEVEQSSINKQVKILYPPIPTRLPSKPAEVPKPVSPVAPTPTPASSTVNMQLSPKKNSAFDIGLLIAFPVIVGTLALFFVFPLLAPQLAKNLPPPMSY